MRHLCLNVARELTIDYSMFRSNRSFFERKQQQCQSMVLFSIQMLVQRRKRSMIESLVLA